MIQQNPDKLPDEIRRQARFFPVKHDKSPKIKGWNNPANQKNYKQLDLPVGFDISSHRDKPSPFPPDYLVYDFDHVLDDEGQFVSETARTVYEQIKAIGTFGEFSQSGHGFHFILKPTPGKFPTMGSVKLYLDDRTDLRENQRAKLEVFYKSSGRYFIFTGNLIPDSTNVIVKDKAADQLIEDILRQIDEQKSAKVNTAESSTDILPPDTTSASQSSNPNPEQPTELERAEEMLKYIDPAQCSYDEWINVGMIIKNLDGTLDIWDDWSSRDTERYNKSRGQSCQDKWLSFKDDGRLTIATLHG